MTNTFDDNVRDTNNWVTYKTWSCINFGLLQVQLAV